MALIDYTSPEYILEFLKYHGPINVLMLEDLLFDAEIEQVHRTGQDSDILFGERFCSSLDSLKEKGMIRYRGGDNPLYMTVYATYGKDETPRTIFTWNAAMDWAREKGVPLKKGKVTKETAHLRIYEYGLMDEFNREWPEYQFHINSVEKAKELQEARGRRAKRAAYFKKKYSEGSQ